MLQIRDLLKIYPGPVTALKGVSLEVPNGLFGLLGPNGAGKSTLMTITAGLLQPTAGTITLDGQDIVTDPSIVRRSLGYLPQEFGFYPELSGLKMLMLMLRLKGVDAPQGRRKLAEELLERVNLAHAARRKVGGYSGGMRQRLGLAQAVAGSPRLIIVDEPTAGLDPEERHRFYRLLAELGKDRIVVLSTHIVEDVATLCPRMAIIRGGSVMAHTTPAKAREGIEGRVFEGFVRDEELSAFTTTHRVLSAILVEGVTNRVRVAVHAGADSVPSGFRAVPATLEDAYMDVIRGPVGGAGVAA
ncbi:MAG: ATP-binding cassette domain-containing protein [Phycisphaerales bacterium]